MKTLGKIITSLILILVIGCSPNSTSDTQPTVIELTGNWRMNSYSYSGEKTVIDVEEVTHSQFTGIGWELFMDMIFTEEPNNYNSSGNYKVDHIVIDDDGNETLYYGYFEVDDVGTWNRSNNSISLTLDGETINGIISQLTETELKLVMHSSSSTTSGATGIITNISRNDTYNFTRN